MMRFELRTPALILQLLIASLVVTGSGEGSLVLAPAPKPADPKPCKVGGAVLQPVAIHARLAPASASRAHGHHRA